MKVYDWIDRNMTDKRRICDMNINLESCAQSEVSSSEIYETREAEFKPIRIEVESWPSYDSSAETVSSLVVD
jgi:hypothetical protein